MKHRLSLSRIEEASQTIDATFLNSPQYISEPISNRLDTTVVLKVETVNPIRCFKGRGADFLVSKLKEKQGLICASAGNFGQAMAYACRKRGIALSIYASRHANSYKVERMRALGATVILDGEDFDTAKLKAKEIAKQEGLRFVEDGLDIETLEGAGTIGLELLKIPLDFLCVPLGNGALFNGVARVMKEKSSRTKMIAVQAAGAPAMIESWKNNRVITHPSVTTIADGIAVRIPIPQAVKDMKGLCDDSFLVNESSIIQAMKLLHEEAGLVIEPSAAVGVAAMIENPNYFRGKKVGTILCGGNLTPEQIHTWLS